MLQLLDFLKVIVLLLRVFSVLCVLEFGQTVCRNCFEELNRIFNVGFVSTILERVTSIIKFYGNVSTDFQTVFFLNLS